MKAEQNISRRSFLKSAAAATILAPTIPWWLDLPVPLLTEDSTYTPPSGEKWLPTTCWIGKQNCGMLARVVDGRVIKLEGHPDHPRNLGRLCPKGQAQLMSVYDPYRVKAPLKRTNAKGVPGEWKEVTWDEALDIVAKRIKEAQVKDKRLAIYVPGREHVGAIYATAFPDAVATPKYGRRGNDCGGPSEDAVLATWGDRSLITPDFRHCRYLICYWNLTQAGGPGLCWITYPREVVEAKERGMKVISIDPYAKSVARLADEWVPIKPGTDMAFWLATIHVLLRERYIDEEFLKSYTNAPSLVKEDGALLREGGKELVWDNRTRKPVPYGLDVDPALFGEFVVAGEKVKPALQVLKDHVTGYSPVWAAGVCGVPVEQIEKIARELGQNAMIGSKIVIDGVEVPYRPVAFGMHGTSIKFHSAIQSCRAILLTFMILGAIEAAGSAHFWGKKVSDPAKVHAGWLKAAEKEVPDRLDLGGSKWFPLGSSGYHMFPVTVLEPDKYKIPYRPEDMVLLVHKLNPLMTSRPTDKVIEAWKRFGFVVVVSPFMSETADYAADIVLPSGTLDKLEGPLGVKTLYYSADSVRAPVMNPFYQTKSEIDIYIDLCEKLGKLYGKDGFIDRTNKALAIKKEYLLPLDKKPTVEGIIDAWSRSKYGVDLNAFLSKGVISKKVSADKLYLSAWKPPFGGVRAHFYLEAFLKLKEELRKRGVPETLWTRYTPYPVWSEPVMEQSPPDYDLYLMDYKMIEYKQSRTGFNPLQKEIASKNPLIMNEKTAKRLGLRDGDLVLVESHNPVTKETRKVRATLAVSQGIRPDTVALSHHFGHFGPHVVPDPDEPNVNRLFFYGDGFWDIGSGWFSHVKVKVTRARVT